MRLSRTAVFHWQDVWRLTSASAIVGPPVTLDNPNDVVTFERAPEYGACFGCNREWWGESTCTCPPSGATLTVFNVDREAGVVTVDGKEKL